MNFKKIILILCIGGFVSSSVHSVIIKSASQSPVAVSNAIALGSIALADPFDSASNSMAAVALTAKTPSQFRKKQRLAVGFKAAQLLMNLLVVPYLVQNRDAAIGVDIAVWWAVALYTLMRAGVSIKSIIQHMKYAKNAEQLFALLQSAEFKKQYGVSDWATVAKRRNHAELIATGAAGMIGGIGAAAAFGPAGVKEVMSNKLGISSLAGVGAFSAALGLKPFISRFIRQKGSVRGLEAAFNKAILDKKKNPAA